MKKIFLIGLFTSILSLISCSGDDEGESSANSITVTADVTSTSYVNDPITFLTMTDGGRNVTSNSTYYVNGTAITGNVYTPTSTGTLNIYATYVSGSTTLTSPTIIINIAQSIAFNKKVLIEDFTGTWCGYCPRVSYAIEQVNARTTDAVIVAIHRGNDPYNFAGATDLENQIGLSGYPTAMLNRNIDWAYPETSTNSINQAVNLTTGTNPRLGIALETTTTGNTGTVKVNVKFGKDFSNLKLVVYAVENDLIYNQTNYTSYYGGVSTISNFDHDHVLRAVLTTSILGENITGSTNYNDDFTKTFIYAIPTNVNTANVKYIAVVVDSSKRAVNSREAGSNETQTFEVE
jgi:thiol-disulfide isomerase/thioredoxin